MTQIPWFDRLWNKSRFAAMFKQQSASPILKVVMDRTQGRLRKTKRGQLDQGKDDVNEKDFVSRFIDIQSTNKSVPPW
jgi:hypothetical protein